MSDHIPDPTKMIRDTPISDSTPHNVAELGTLCRRSERELNAANERIKRLDETLEAVTDKLDGAWGIYMKFKEAKP